MSRELETLKALIKSECMRTIEMLDLDVDLTRYTSHEAFIRSELKAKMHELRRDTKRLEHLMGY